MSIYLRSLADTIIRRLNVPKIIENIQKFIMSAETMLLRTRMRSLEKLTRS